VKQQVPIGFGPEMRARLEAAAAAAGRSLAEEVRTRIERSFVNDDRDPALRTLLADLAEVAALVRADTGGAWDKNAASHAVFRAAVLALLAEHEPQGPAMFGAVRDLLGARVLGEDDDPASVGRAIARFHLRNRPPKIMSQSAMAKLARHIRKKKD
jgi:hypothetical protein